MCQTYAYVTCVFTSVSVWTIAALSWDKYQTIASPLHHSLTATLEKMVPCFLAFWACGVLLSLPPLLGANEFVFHTTMGICGVNHSSSKGRWYTCLLVTAFFVLPFCLMIYCYAHIFRIARTQSSRIAATMLRMVSVIQAPIAAPAVSSSQGSSSLSLRGTKAMGTILQLIGSFVLTYLPYSIIVLYEVVFSEHANAVFVSIATTLFLAAPFTHAAIYGLRNQILRTSFYRYSRRKYQDLKSRRAPCCWCRGGRGSLRDKRRGSIKGPIVGSNKHSLSYVKRGSMAPPQAVRCVVKADGRQYVLRRAVSYQEHNHGADHPQNLDISRRVSQGHEEPNSLRARANGPIVTGDLVSSAMPIPRPHSLSDMFRPASILSVGNANVKPSATCYPTSPLLVHASNGKIPPSHFGYSSLLEGCVGNDAVSQQDSNLLANTTSAVEVLSAYHIPVCQDRRLQRQSHKADNCWRDNSAFGKDLLEEMSHMEEELEEISRADENTDTRLETLLTLNNHGSITSTDVERCNRIIPYYPSTVPAYALEKRDEKDISRSKRVRDGLMVKLSQLASNQRVGKKPSFGSAGSRGLGSIEDSSVFDADNSPDTEAKSSVFGSCQLNELDSVISVDEREKDSIFDCVRDMEMSNFELEPDHIVHIVSSQV